MEGFNEVLVAVELAFQLLHWQELRSRRETIPS